MAQAIGAITVLAVIGGCNASGPAILQILGHYEGVLTDHSDGKTYQQTPVTMDVASDKRDPMILAATDESRNNKISLQISNATDTTLSVQSTPGMKKALNLSFDPKTQCYSGSGDVSATLCANEAEIRFELQSPKGTGSDKTTLSLVLHHFNINSSIPAPETPRAYALSEAIERTRNLSFASRIEFEHVVQAKLTARAAYLHLLPQITLGTVMNNVTVAPLSFVGTFSTLIQAIGDLAPFLLPDRWFQASAAQHQSKAEQDTAVLLRLDTGIQVEGLFYAYDRDKHARDATQEFLAHLTDPRTGIRHEVQIREDMGQLPKGSARNIDSIINQTQQNLEVLIQVTTEDLAAISQSLGFYTPKAVTDATIDTELIPIDQARPYDFDTVNNVASCQNPNGECRSYEVDQMDDLIASANDTKIAKYFSWLDPAGDPNLGLGAALPSQIELSSSQIKELKIDRQQLQSILSLKVLNAVTDYQQALNNYRQAQDGLEIQTDLYNTAKANIETGVNPDLFAFTGIMQNLMAAQITLQTAIANYRVARSQIDRLLLQGFYANF